MESNKSDIMSDTICERTDRSCINSRGDIARAYFREGYNCSQSVALAFEAESGLDRETLLKLSSSFGGGMGRLREVCGAMSGVFIIAGLLFGYTSTTDKEEKSAHYALIQELAKQFTDKNETLICRQLLKGIPLSDGSIPAERTAEFYATRPCERLIGDAADILDNYLRRNCTL